MKQTLKTIVAFLVAAVIMLAVRTYVFTIYTVPADIDRHIVKGNRVGVLHWLCSDIQRGDVVVYGDSIKNIGKVKAVPCDSVVNNGIINHKPKQCCSTCNSSDCHTFMLVVSGKETLVQKHDMLGKAWRLY